MLLLHFFCSIKLLYHEGITYIAINCLYSHVVLTVLRFLSGKMLSSGFGAVWKVLE